MAAASVAPIAEIMGMSSEYPEDCEEEDTYPPEELTGWSPGYGSCRRNAKMWNIVSVPLCGYMVYRWWNSKHDGIGRQGPGEPHVMDKLEAAGSPDTTEGQLMDFYGTTFFLEVLCASAVLWNAGNIFFATAFEMRPGWDRWEPSHGGSQDVWRFLCLIVFFAAGARWAQARLGYDFAQLQSLQPSQPDPGPAGARG